MTRRLLTVSNKVKWQKTEISCKMKPEIIADGIGKIEAQKHQK